MDSLVELQSCSPNQAVDCRYYCRHSSCLDVLGASMNESCYCYLKIDWAFRHAVSVALIVFSTDSKLHCKGANYVYSSSSSACENSSMSETNRCCCCFAAIGPSYCANYCLQERLICFLGSIATAFDASQGHHCSLEGLQVCAATSLMSLLMTASASKGKSCCCCLALTHTGAYH